MVKSLIVLAAVVAVALSAPMSSVNCTRPAKEPATSNLYLEIIRMDGSAGPVLGEKSTICPDDYPAGFSILCKGFKDGTKYATFYKNGAKLRREASAPFAVSGNFGTRYVKFKAFSLGDSFTIKCDTNLGEETETLADFSC